MSEFVLDLSDRIEGGIARRLRAEEERALSRRGWAAERTAREAVAGRPDAERAFARVQARSQELDALLQAVEALIRDATSRPVLQGAAGRAGEALRRAALDRWRLAMSASDVARGEARKYAGPFIDEEDLVQEGLIGLLQAARRWDPERGIRFRIYARWWVRAQLSRAVDHTGRPIRLPANAAETLRKLREVRERRRGAGEDAGVSSLAEELGIEPARARELLGHGYTVSLESPLERHGGSPRTLSSTLRDDRAPAPDQVAARTQQRERLRHAVAMVLTTQQRVVMTRRYGLEDGRYRTLSEVGAELGLSRERIRQIERLALQRIRRRCEAPLRGQLS